MTLSTINRLYSVIDNSLFMVTGKLDYDRITDALISLSNAVHEYGGDNDDMWAIGEFEMASLPDLITGAYWHFTEWHGGQWSNGYAALSALGQVFQPGMTSGPEPDSSEFEAYQALNTIAETQ